jgi:hypothetical protein
LLQRGGLYGTPFPREVALAAVLPGPEQACPPFQQKYTTIWQKHTANSYFVKIPLLFRYFT